MGNSMTAAANDYHAVYYNPALLMTRKYAHAGLAFNWVEPLLTIDGNGEKKELLPERNLGFHLGISTTIGGIFKDKIAFGACFFVPLLRLTRAESIDYGVPQFYMYENLPDKMLVLVAGAYEPWDWLSLGVGLQILGDIDGSADIQLSLVDQQVTQRRLSIDLHANLGVTAGLAFKPYPGLSIGVSYREAVELTYNIPLRTLVEELGALAFEIEGSGLYSPHQINVGIAWNIPNIPLLLTSDLTVALWSLASSPAPKADVTLDTSQLQETPKNIVDIQSTYISLDASTIVIPRIGLEYSLSNIQLRAGYFFRPTPLPTPAYETNYVDSEAHAVTFGGSWQYKNTDVNKSSLILGLALQLTHLTDRKVTKSQPDTTAGDYTAGGNIFSLLFDVQLDF